ncbi:MAG: O-antigen ligase family protein [Clostridia bacterium]|nr:O-antigen ligase family protein [Clostridia bacterium]
MSDNDKNHIELAKKMILLSTLSCFVYSWVARAAIVVSVLTFFFLPVIRRKVFSRKSSYLVLAFSVLGFIVSLCYFNIYGIASYPMFFAIVCFCAVTRAIANREFFEKILDTMCIGGCIATGISVIEKILYIPNFSIRVQAGFPNPNFLGAALMMVVFVCIYKVANKAEKVWFYCSVAVFNAVGILLCGSMSLWVVMAIGAIILFVLNKNTKMLIALLSAIALVFLALFFIPQIFTRLDEVSLTTQNRVNIWSFAIENIKTAPIFGRGFFAYKHLYNQVVSARPEIMQVSLAHNLLLDSVLCHGVVGTGILAAYLGIYFKELISCRKALNLNKKSLTLNSFIIAVCIAIACYGFIDTTFVWVQSGGILLLLAMAGLGADEKEIKA